MRGAWRSELDGHTAEIEAAFVVYAALASSLAISFK